MIESRRLILRDWNQQDIPSLVDGLNDLEVSKWLAMVPFPYTEQDARNFIQHCSQLSDGYEFAIVRKLDNCIIGGTSLNQISRLHKTAGGGIWLNRKYQGMGYGTETFGLRIRFAFEQLGLRKLENGYFAGNQAPWKMQQKFGYKQEGIRRQKYICPATGETVDEVLTGLLREEWIDFLPETI